MGIHVGKYEFVKNKKNLQIRGITIYSKNIFHAVNQRTTIIWPCKKLTTAFSIFELIAKCGKL